MMCLISWFTNNFSYHFGESTLYPLLNINCSTDLEVKLSYVFMLFHYFYIFLIWERTLLEMHNNVNSSESHQNHTTLFQPSDTKVNKARCTFTVRKNLPFFGSEVFLLTHPFLLCCFPEVSIWHPYSTEMIMCWWRRRTRSLLWRLKIPTLALSCRTSCGLPR